MPTTLNSGLQLPDKGSVDWYGSMQTNYNLLDNHLENTDIHVTAEDKANWDSKQGSLSQTQLDAIAQVSTNTSDIASLQSGKADASHTHSSSDITDIGDYATKQYVDNSISGLVDSAPAALDTLNELSAALNDDSNFASTVTTALATKANSADLATVATSGSYNDLSNKPTINDSTITIQKNGSTVDTFTVNGSAKTIDIPVPTKTSDLTNDSNFVDTSNSAVASGITSAKVTDYDTHIADTDIHVTTADKNRWNNQTYVFRYSSTALVASSTNSNTLLDNTDNLKVGDKVIDSSGVLFSITAIDTANSTFTIGTALIDLAQDSDVVHKSGNETVGGNKTFTNDVTVNNSNATVQADVPDLVFKNPLVERASTTLQGEQTILFTDKNDNNIGSIQAKTYTSGMSDIILTSYSETSDQSVRTTGIVIRRTSTTSKLHGYSDNITSLGDTNRRWKSVYATNYYYGSNNVEFSTKFVTTDTAQTISGNKTFSSNVNVYNSDTNATTPNLYLRSSKTEISSQGNTSGDQNLTYLDKNNTTYAYIKGAIQSNGSAVKIRAVAKDSSDNSVVNELQMLAGTNGNKAIFPLYSNEVDLGVSNYKWKSFNGVEPSSLSLPSGNTADRVDISSYITAFDGTSNTYTPPANGWISISANNSTEVYVFLNNLYGAKNSRPTAGSIIVTLPVLKDMVVAIRITDGSLGYARFIPCQGNV